MGLGVGFCCGYVRDVCGGVVRGGGDGGVLLPTTIRDQTIIKYADQLLIQSNIRKGIQIYVLLTLQPFAHAIVGPSRNVKGLGGAWAGRDRGETGETNKQKTKRNAQ